MDPEESPRGPEIKEFNAKTASAPALKNDSQTKLLWEMDQATNSFFQFSRLSISSHSDSEPRTISYYHFETQTRSFE